MPTGVSGRVVCLLSGGIDSPVAAYRLMRRGCRVMAVHFHSYPILSRASQEKVRELAALLTRYQQHTKVYMVPFGEIQQQVVLAVAPPLRVVIYRRLMVRIAEALADEVRRESAGHRGSDRPGGISDAGKHDVDRIGGHAADFQAADRDGQGRDHARKRRSSAPIRSRSSRIRTAASCSRPSIPPRKRGRATSRLPSGIFRSTSLCSEPCGEAAVEEFKFPMIECRAERGT